MTVYVGIDVHKHFCQAAIMNENGKLVHELRFDNNTEGAHSLVNLAKSINPHVKAVVEPSANYWIKVYDKLEDEGVEIKLPNPNANASKNHEPHPCPTRVGNSDLQVDWSRLSPASHKNHSNNECQDQDWTCLPGKLGNNV